VARQEPIRPTILLRKGQLLPDSAMVGLDGRQASLSSVVAGKKSLLVVLSAQCGACELLAARFNEEYARMGPEYRLIGISSDPIPQLSQFRKNGNLAFPLFNDSPGRFIDRYEINTFPATIGLNRDGQIAFIEFGFLAGKDLSHYLKRL
jgi:peroxiredoxin